MTLGLNNLTKPDDWESIVWIEIRARSDSADYNGTVIKFSKIQVEKGATATDYEPYGYYKIPVTMTGKNLFDFKAIYSDTTKFTITDGVVTGSYRSFESARYKMPKVLIGKELTFSADLKDNGNENSSIAVMAAQNDHKYGNFVRPADGVKKSVVKFTPANENDYVTIVYYTGDMLMSAQNIQLEIGNTATEYEPYNGKTYNIYLSEPLRKVENVADYVDCVSKEVVRCVGVNSITGALEVLSTPKRESIAMENIDFTGIKHIFVNTAVTPSNVEVKY